MAHLVTCWEVSSLKPPETKTTCFIYANANRLPSDIYFICATVEQILDRSSIYELVIELELELITQTQMAQKPMLRAEVYAHAMRASQNRKKEVRREKKV